MIKMPKNVDSLSGKVYDNCPSSKRDNCQNHYIYCEACSPVNNYHYYFPKENKLRDAINNMAQIIKNGSLKK